MLAIVGIQFGGGLLGFLTWAGLSHAASGRVVELGAHILAIGMLIYLPLTLGLPFLLPNFFRQNEVNGAAMANAAYSIRTIAVASLAAQVVGLILAAVGSGNGWPTNYAGPALVFGGLICAGSTLQQMARIENRVGLMILGSSYNVSLPLVTLMCVRFTDSGLGLPVMISAGLASLGVIQVLLCLRTVQRFDISHESRAEVRHVLATSLPLVPHLLAFGVLTQGLRIPTMFGSSTESTLTAHFTMLFVGLSLAVVTGINSVLAVTIQRAAEDQVGSVLTLMSWAYGALGLLASAALMCVYRSPVRNLFDGAPQFSRIEIALLAFIPSAFCSYFFLSSLMIRYRRTWGLLCSSGPVAIGYAALAIWAERSGTDVQLQMEVYAVSLLALPVLVFGFAVVQTPFHFRALLLSSLRVLCGFAPCLIVAFWP